MWLCLRPVAGQCVRHLPAPPLHTHTHACPSRSYLFTHKSSLNQLGSQFAFIHPTIHLYTHACPSSQLRCSYLFTHKSRLGPLGSMSVEDLGLISYKVEGVHPETPAIEAMALMSTK